MSERAMTEVQACWTGKSAAQSSSTWTCVLIALIGASTRWIDYTRCKGNSINNFVFCLFHRMEHIPKCSSFRYYELGSGEGCNRDFARKNCRGTSEEHISMRTGNQYCVQTHWILCHMTRASMTLIMSFTLFEAASSIATRSCAIEPLVCSVGEHNSLTLFEFTVYF